MTLRAAEPGEEYEVEILPGQRENLGKLLRHARARVMQERPGAEGRILLRVLSVQAVV
ncbi:MAG: hypothetical protein PHX58_14605 [Desulfovibrio sp.]|nr:hypothetical protein [Desulfovibrio sp.]